MADGDLTAAQRESLRCYIEAEGEDITPTFVFRFYIPRLVRWAIAFTLFGAAIFVLIPTAPTISVRSAMLILNLGLFVGLVALSAWTSVASVENWRLLQRILDWASVRHLYNSTDTKNESQHGG